MRRHEEPGDDRWVDDRLPVSESLECVDEGHYVEDPLFEEVADPLGVLLEQLHGGVRLDVLGENQHAYLWVLGSATGDVSEVGLWSAEERQHCEHAAVMLG